MSRSHILIKGLDRVRTAQLAELLVHIVCTATRVVAHPDTEVLDLQWLEFVNLCAEALRLVLKQ